MLIIFVKPVGKQTNVSPKGSMLHWQFTHSIGLKNEAAFLKLTNESFDRASNIPKSRKHNFNVTIAKIRLNRAGMGLGISKLALAQSRACTPHEHYPELFAPDLLQPFV